MTKVKNKKNYGDYAEPIFINFVGKKAYTLIKRLFHTIKERLAS